MLEHVLKCSNFDPARSIDIIDIFDSFIDDEDTEICLCKATKNKTSLDPVWFKVDDINKE